MNTTPTNQGDFGQRTTAPSPIVPKTASEALRPENGTPPPARAKRSKRSRNQFVVFLNFLMSAIMLVTLTAAVAVYFGKRSFEAAGPAATNATFMVKPSTGVAEIAEQLERRGLISDARVFQVGVRAYGNSSSLKAGEYEIKAGASMHDIMEILKSGRSILYSLTVPEGLTVAQAWQRIADNEALSGEMPATMPQEGMLAADTLRFTRGTPRRQVVEKMLADQKKLVEEIWDRRAAGLPLANINEFVTLASIVEKETGRGDERSRVASVFINRLNKNMRLQSDPTIIYGLFGGKGKPSDRPIMQSDIDKPTAYNTYVINGLPPTPIANPGKAALEAVANPSQTSDLYFVADGNGGHVFAATLEEHNANVARYRAVQKKQAEEAAKAGAAAGGTSSGGPTTTIAQ
jgi:UPF0755 protein